MACSCQTNPCSCQVQKVSTIDALRLLERMIAEPELTVLNVLDKDTYEKHHIRGSINIPLDRLESCIHELQKGKDIVVYCAHNGSSMSKNAYHTLKKHGFNNISVYEGGIKEWREKGLPTEPIIHKPK